MSSLDTARQSRVVVVKHVVVRTQKHRLDADDTFPILSVGWTWQGFCRDLDPCWYEQGVVTMMWSVNLRTSL